MTRRRLSVSDVADLKVIQAEIEGLYTRSQAIFKRLEAEDEAQHEFAQAQFLDPLGCAMVGADDAIKVVQQVVEEMEAVRKVVEGSKARRRKP